MDEDRNSPFEVDHMPLETLEQPMANNECRFYIMWAMLHYLRGKTKEGDEMVCMLHILCISVNSMKRSTVVLHLCISTSSCLNNSGRNLATKSCQTLRQRIPREELATFIFDEVLTKDGAFSIAWSKKYKQQFDKEMLDILL